MMKSEAMKKLSKIAMMVACAGFITGCNTLSRLAKVGDEPKLTEIENPTRTHSYKPVSMPMPMPTTAIQTQNSLWRVGSQTFFKDQRASRVGDIITVLININDSAQLKNETTQVRDTNIDSDPLKLLGLENGLTSILSEKVNPAASLLDVDTGSNSKGTGTIQRNEAIKMQVAAVVTQILPNGNLVIHGRQETRVNYEVRELQVAGVIRPQDITNANTVSYEDIAEARVSYGGRGQISDLQQPKYGTQLVDILLPF